MEEIYILAKDLDDNIKEHFKNQDLISVYDLICLIEELDYEIEDLKEEIEDIKQDIEDNYRPIPINEQYEIYDSDFI